jgi:hypothetical protein
MANTAERVRKGSYPPYASLAEAFLLAERIYENGGGQASYDMFSRLTGNSSSSSSFVRKLAAMKAYGLLAEAVKGQLILTETGIRIAAPRDADAAGNARKQAFTSIDTFNRIFDRHKGKLLPADEFLKNMIEQECEIPRDLSKLWVSAFKDSLKTAGLLHDRGDGKFQILESPVVMKSVSVAAAVRQNGPAVEADKSHAADAYVQAPVSEAEPNAGLNIKIRLSSGQSASFYIPDKLSARDAQKLKGALEGFGSMIDSLVSDQE